MPKRGHKKQSGGADSGWSYVMSQVGDGWKQFQDSLTLQPGQNLATIQSNDIEPIGKPNFQNHQGMPTSKQLSLIQSAGKRRKRRMGGSWAALANQAAAPVALLAMQQSYGKRKSRSTKKRRMGGSWAALANQAAAPVALLAMQQSYGKRKSRSTKKHRKSRRR